jgi:dephospho-CoA kinase
MTMKIALIGKIRAGKDLVGNYLIVRFGMYRFAFGDPVNEVAKKLFPEAFENRAKPRKVLQLVGQRMREIDPDIWLNATLSVIETTKDIHHHHVYISDVRQPNEVERLRNEGYILIRINATDETRINRMLSAGDAFTLREVTHETEKDIDSYEVDYEIDNNGSSLQTYIQVEDIIRKIGGK